MQYLSKLARAVLYGEIFMPCSQFTAEKVHLYCLVNIHRVKRYCCRVPVDKHFRFYILYMYGTTTCTWYDCVSDIPEEDYSVVALFPESSGCFSPVWIQLILKHHISHLHIEKKGCYVNAGSYMSVKCQSQKGMKSLNFPQFWHKMLQWQRKPFIYSTDIHVHFIAKIRKTEIDIASQMTRPISFSFTLWQNRCQIARLCIFCLDK